MSKPAYLLFGHELEAAAATDATALLRLADAVQQGWRGHAASEARALELLQRAAAMGHPRAMRRLGDRFTRGDGVEKNHEVALRWWRNAAAAGDVDAMANLICLARSGDPAEVAEGRRWLELAASHGQPYAVHTLRGGASPAMADFAKLSLEEMAAGAPAPSGEELAWSVEEVEISLAQLNDLVGWWLERLRAFWTDLSHDSTVDGDDTDFPCPDVRALPAGLTADNDTIEVSLHAGVVHLQLDATLWDEGWNLSLCSFEPHPPPDGQRWIVGELLATATQLGIRLG